MFPFVYLCFGICLPVFCSGIKKAPEISGAAYADK